MAFARLLASVSIVVLLPSAAHADVMVDVQGQSGKFTVYDEATGRASGIQVTMDALKEVDASGNEVGTSGSTKHSINTFAAQAFAIDPAEATTLNNGNGIVNATLISFSSPISTIGQIRIDTYVISEEGSVGTPSETWTVRPGDLKWNIELSAWNWCGCQKGQSVQVGAFVDVDVTVKGSAAAQKESGSNKTLSLGGDSKLELSNQVQVDGSWQLMPAGYPIISIQGSSTTFTFRFPRFADKALYDPLITGLVETASITTTATTTTTMSETSSSTSTMTSTVTSPTTTDEANTDIVVSGTKAIEAYTLSILVFCFTLAYSC